MSDITDRLRDPHLVLHYGDRHEAADQIDRLRAEVEHLQIAHQEHAAEIGAEIEALRAELEHRRKSGSASDRLHNLCESIAADADGSEFSREEWDRIDAENVALRAEVERHKDLLQAVEWLLDDGHMNQEHLARIRAAWEAAMAQEPRG